MVESFYETELGKLYHGDCLELMKDIPDSSIDLVLTDPPYNASNFKRNFKDKCYKPINEAWDRDNTIAVDIVSELNRVVKPNGSLLMFCSHHLLPYLLMKIGEHLQVKQILHWVKTNPMPSSSNIYTFSVEYIIWVTNGKNYWGSTKKYDTKGKSYTYNKNPKLTDVFKYPIVSGKVRTPHPTQKPLQLIKDLLEVHSNENHLVLDAFSGSGTTGVACENLDRKYILMEKELEYCEIAKKRIIESRNQLKLFSFGDL